MTYDPASGSIVSATPDSCAMICCVRSAMLHAVFGGQPQRLVARVGVQRLRAAQHRRQRLQRHAHDVVLRLLRRQRRAAGLRVEAQLQRIRVLRAKAIAHEARPQPPRRAELGDFFEEVVVRVEEERELRREVVDLQAGLQRRFDVRDRIRQRERHFLHRRRSGLADVIAADADRVPVRHVLARSTGRCR